MGSILNCRDGLNVNYPYGILGCHGWTPTGGPVLETEVELHWGQALRFGR